MRKAWLLNPLVHFLFDALRIIGLRDRLRCPRCKAVGTWKPHGGILDREDKRKVRRWMCKWCGLYAGPEGVLQVYPNPNIGHWVFEQDSAMWRTPQQNMETYYGEGRIWPWRG